MSSSRKRANLRLLLVGLRRLRLEARELLGRL